MRHVLDANERAVMRIWGFHRQIDAVKHWNQSYGPRGFDECHFLVAEEHCTASIHGFLRATERFGIRPFFAVVKTFGPHERQRMISFPAPRITIMAKLQAAPVNQPFFEYFTDYVKELRERIYLARDSYLATAQFEDILPRIDEWRSVVRRYDPENIQSDLSRRLSMKLWQSDA